MMKLQNMIRSATWILTIIILLTTANATEYSVYHPDHLGSTDLVTNQSGGVVEESTYEPHGEIVAGGISRFLFTGKELDKHSGLYYYCGVGYDVLFSGYRVGDGVP